MSHKHERRAARMARELFEKLQKLFAGDGVEAGARLVENEQTRLRHQCAGNQHALSFSLGKINPRPFFKMGKFDVLEPASRESPISATGFGPEVELCEFAAHHCFQCFFCGGNGRLKRARDDPDLRPQVAPIRFAITLTK